MHIVARIADERGALLVAWQVNPTISGEQLGRAVHVVKERTAGGPCTVNHLEVQLRHPNITKSGCIDVRCQRRAVRGDVVCDELAEYRPPGRLPSVVRASC